jgi:putative tryptophan/tyrosine transport system substrate-binding protein
MSDVILGVGKAMRRREVIWLIGSAVATWPLAGRTQEPMPVIGFLSARSPDDSADALKAFELGLNEGGFVKGQTVAITFRWAEGHYDRLQELAAELVQNRVTVIAAFGGDPAAHAAKAATKTIPIIFATGGDPVAAGLVASCEAA